MFVIISLRRRNFVAQKINTKIQLKGAGSSYFKIDFYTQQLQHIEEHRTISKERNEQLLRNLQNFKQQFFQSDRNCNESIAKLSVEKKKFVSMLKDYKADAIQQIQKQIQDLDVQKQEEDRKLELLLHQKSLELEKMKKQVQEQQLQIHQQQLLQQKDVPKIADSPPSVISVTSSQESRNDQSISSAFQEYKRWKESRRKSITAESQIHKEERETKTDMVVVSDKHELMTEDDVEESEDEIDKRLSLSFINAIRGGNGSNDVSEKETKKVDNAPAKRTNTNDLVKIIEQHIDDADDLSLIKDIREKNLIIPETVVVTKTVTQTTKKNSNQASAVSNLTEKIIHESPKKEDEMKTKQSTFIMPPIPVTKKISSEPPYKYSLTPDLAKQNSVIESLLKRSLPNKIISCVAILINSISNLLFIKSKIKKQLVAADAIKFFDARINNGCIYSTVVDVRYSVCKEVVNNNTECLQRTSIETLLEVLFDIVRYFPEHLMPSDLYLSIQGKISTGLLKKKFKGSTLDLWHQLLGLIQVIQKVDKLTAQKVAKWTAIQILPTHLNSNSEKDAAIAKLSNFIIFCAENKDKFADESDSDDDSSVLSKSVLTTPSPVKKDYNARLVLNEQIDLTPAKNFKLTTEEEDGDTFEPKFKLRFTTATKKKASIATKNQERDELDF